jgi:hypothetical protein
VTSGVLRTPEGGSVTFKLAPRGARWWQRCRTGQRPAAIRAAQSTQLRLSPPGGKPMTQVTLFDQGLVQVLQAAVTGLEPKQPYVLALATQPDGVRNASRRVPHVASEYFVWHNPIRRKPQSRTYAMDANHSRS